MLPSKRIGFVTAFSPGLATTLSHAAVAIYCLALEMKRRAWRCRARAVLRGQGVWKYSSRHVLCSHHGLAFLRSPKPLPAVSVKFVCKPGDRSLSRGGFQYCTGMKCPRVSKKQNHSCSWGWAGSPMPVSAGCGRGHGAPAEL